MFHWYVINTYSGHENKVRQNLLHRVETMGQKRTLPGYVLVHMELDDDSWHVVKNTPGVTGFVGAQKPVALSKGEVDRILHVATLEQKPRPTAEFSLGETVKVISGPLADFDGEIIEVNAEAGRLKVAVSIFERSVPVDLTFDQVKRLD